MDKKFLDIDVNQAARDRISYVFDNFKNIIVAFSGGKDSTVMLHLAVQEARTRSRKLLLLFVDLEAQYKLTIQHVQESFEEYTDCVVPYWIALPLHLRNAVSDFSPFWVCWDPTVKDKWVRTPPSTAIVDETRFTFFRRGMEFEEFVSDFGASFGPSTACLVGIRADESLNRFRTIFSKTKRKFDNKAWTTVVSADLINCYPIYDWATKDIWTYHAKFGGRYNKLYDRMHKAGLSIAQQRICQPYGDDQRKGLWLYHVIEPETWGKVVARVAGANSGALYAQEPGNILGRLAISLPQGHTWQSFTHLLLATMPSYTAEHYKNKISVFLKWWSAKGYDTIPDQADPKSESDRTVPSWRRICKALLRHDFWCKGLSFTQTKSDHYQRYLTMAKQRRAKWGIL